MFSKVFSLAAFGLALSAQVHAHAAISPVLGVAGAPKRSDVQRPTAAKPCGKTAIASNIDTSTPVVANADGSFTVTVTNFNSGRDGSRQVTMTVDAAGTGDNFVAGQVTKNGVAAPTSVGSDQVTASLPAGTKCSGGQAGNLCIASFKTLGGFGNCVVVQQGAGGAANSAGGKAPAGAAAATGPATNGTTTATAKPATASNAQTGNAQGNGKAGGRVKQATQDRIDRLKGAFGNAVGTRAPRAIRRELEIDE